VRNGNEDTLRTCFPSPTYLEIVSDGPKRDRATGKGSERHLMTANDAVSFQRARLEWSRTATICTSLVGSLFVAALLDRGTRMGS
jgi:hypothetical protein